MIDMIRIKFGEREIELTVSEARELYRDLKGMFYEPQPTPFVPNIRPSVDAPYYPTITCKNDPSTPTALWGGAIQPPVTSSTRGTPLEDFQK